MRSTTLGNCFEVSKLTLGGGGIGQVWGETDQTEALATVRLAYEAGINCFDLAPLYGDGEAERVVGQVFKEGYPDDVRVTTKCMLGQTAANQVLHKLTQSLDASCARLGRDYVDVFILHGYVIADDWQGSLRADVLPRIAVRYGCFENDVVTAFEALKQQGRIGAWGVTAASTQAENLRVLQAQQAPDVVQCIANLLDSPGNMAITEEVCAPREVISAAHDLGIGVMGIRAVAAGALTDQIDRDVHPKSAENRDFAAAEGFRDIAQRAGESASFLAHQYALSMPGVDTVVLGVKNRTELEDCLRAESKGQMDANLMAEIEAAVGPG